MQTPTDRKYTREHEWVRMQGDEAQVGITYFAQDQLGEIVFVELPKIGTRIDAGKTFCVVESTKAASDVYAPISGTVSAVNEALSTDPSLLNREPYEDAWIIRLKDVVSTEVNSLMEAAAYDEFAK